MRSILYDLYYGEISPAEQYHSTKEEYLRRSQESIARYKSFTKSLQPYQLKMFNQIIDDQYDLLPMEHADFFVQGFRLGAKMIMEIYNEEKLSTKE